MYVAAAARPQWANAAVRDGVSWIILSGVIRVTGISIIGSEHVLRSVTCVAKSYVKSFCGGSFACPHFRYHDMQVVAVNITTDVLQVEGRVLLWRQAWACCVETGAMCRHAHRHVYRQTCRHGHSHVHPHVFRRVCRYVYRYT